MILKIGAHARQVFDQLDAAFAQVRRVTDAGQLQNLRGAHRARGQDDLTGGFDGDGRGPSPNLHALAPYASGRERIEQQTVDMGFRPNDQIFAMANGAQKCLRCVPAPP